ncbi:MAG: RraA family protein [Spirochaetales bacterium]|nr:RraA family protein [Spirochaetales bacterium]
MMNSIIDQLKEIDTPTLSNAIEKLEVRNRISGFADRSLTCLFPELGVMCGYVVTAEIETFSPETKGGLDQNFVDLCRALEGCRKPGIIVFQEKSGHPEFSAHCGEVMATIFQKLGAVGLVSDSAVRDVAEVKSLRFHYFATGKVASHGAFRIVRVQVPVTICGLQIYPGDLLHGDEDGLIKLPERGLEKLPYLTEEIHQVESKLLNYVKTSGFTIDGLSERLTH